MRTLLAFALCLLPLVAQAQSVKLPDEIKATPGSWFIVAPLEVDGGAPKWRFDPGLQEQRLDLLFPPEIADKAKGKVFSAPTGRYWVEAWNAKGDVASEIATCWVIVGTPPDRPDVPPPDQPPPVPTTTPTAATYIYEKDKGSPPPAVLSALNTLNRNLEKKIVATTFEQDTVDGTGQTPEQYKAALAAARSAGLPALVVTAGANREIVLRVVKDPRTDTAVLEAVK